MSELFKRILVALVGIPLTVAIIYLGDLVFTVAIAVVSSLAIIELFNFFEKKELHPYRKTAISANILIIAATYLFIHQILILKSDEVFLFLVLMVIIMVFLLITLWSNKPNAMLNIFASLGGVIYISITFLSLVLLREFSHLMSVLDKNITKGTDFLVGQEPGFILTILISIWLCDTMAYFIGSKFGKHKLFPVVSPKKTWEGFIAGFFGAIIGFVVCSQIPFLLEGLQISQAVILGIIVGTVGQVGDLVESKLKRDTGVKDSSSLLPGHGGILDRFDSIMFVVPVIFMYLFFINY